ncbi:hypothetical protein [Mesorhizobium sp. CN2-181]|uniref:hypothetical protein n=1 Tax=Mesorhizobium yinganensis TaxID=3157707 RepID=UPI0032B73DA6
MRHASFQKERKNLSDLGLREVKQVADRLGEYLLHASCQRQTFARVHFPDLTAVIVAPTDEARATARVLSERLQCVLCEGLERAKLQASKVPVPAEREYLSPEACPYASPYFYHWQSVPSTESKQWLDDVIRRILAIETPSESSMTLVVGHAPQLGWMAQRLTNESIPINRAEIVCIRSNPRWFSSWGQLEWVLSPNVKDLASGSGDAREADLESEIRDKIKGKMESAKLLGAVLTGLVTVVLGIPKDLIPASPAGTTSQAAETAFAVGGTNIVIGIDLSAWKDTNLDLLICYGAAVGFLVIGASLFFLAYFAYDSLLMPTRFWSETSPPVRRRRRVVARPPSSAAWVLYANMLRIWNWRFMPAIWCAIAAPVLLAYSLAVGRLWPDRNPHCALGVLAIVMLLFVGLTYCYARWTRPIIGAED